MTTKSTATRIVSFLGLSNYEAVPYEIERFSGGQRVRTARTVLKDVATVLAADEPCSLVMLGTSDAEAKWFGPEPLFPRELRKGLDASSGGSKRHPLLGFRQIPVGETRAQHWEVFQTLVEALQPKPLTLSYNGHRAQKEPQPPEEIVLDITHGFRSAPFFAASAVAFQRSEQRRLGLSGPRFRIVYAHYEPWKRGADPEGYVVPIWYFDDLVEVLDWNTAIDDLMRHGRADELEQRVKASQAEATRAARKEGLDFPKLQQFGRAARTFADGLATARIPEIITERSTALVKAIQLCREDLVRHIPPLALQLRRLEAQAQKLAAPAVVSPEGIRASLELAGLYMDLQRYAEAAITLRETGVSAYSVELAGERVLQPHHGAREKQRGGDKGFDEERAHHEKQLMGEDAAAKSAALESLRRLMRKIGDLRNDVEHGGFREQSREGSGIRGELKEKLEHFRKLYPPTGQGHQERDDASPAGEGVFLNLSNHGVSTWSQEQQEAARALGLGEPADLPGGMPLVVPEADTEEVNALAEELAQRAVAQGARGAHVAGEFTLTLALVRALQGRGIPCYAATTHREVEECSSPNGETQKVVKFHFIRWRRYG
jgi:CRISPR-associated DxTHG motif protein